jgi:hypothetical protein
MIILLLLLSLVNAFIPSGILNVINNQRKDYDLPVITYSHDLHNELQIWRNAFGPDWFFQNDTEKHTVDIVYKNKTIATRDQNYNGQYLMKYATFDYFSRKGFKYFYRDTFKNSVTDIIKFRANQLKKCFDLKRCDNNSFHNNTSCLKKRPVLENSKTCSWAWWYAPKHIYRSLKEIACVELGIAGLHVPDNLLGIQNNVFFCYGSYDEQLSDSPLKN